MLCDLKNANHVYTHRPVNPEFNVAVLQMASRVMPIGYDVIDNGPETYEALVADVTATGRIRVDRWNSDTSVYADQEVNWAARAWHDWTHWRHRIPFGLFGEVDTFYRQAGDLETIYGHGRQFKSFLPILFADIVGQNIYAYNHGGKFPTDQRQFYGVWAGEIKDFPKFNGGLVSRDAYMAFAAWATHPYHRAMALISTSPEAEF